jgi:excisionase family DNA binding protein
MAVENGVLVLPTVIPPFYLSFYCQGIFLLDIVLCTAEAGFGSQSICFWPSAKRIWPRRAGTMASDGDIFTIRELSEHLRVHPTTIYRLLRQGQLPGFRVGSNWRFNRAAIEQWEKMQAAGPPSSGRRGRHRRT